VTGGAWIVAAAFIAGMGALNRYLRRREEDGSLDVPPSSASRPGLRRLFDFGPQGWSEDGIGQRSAGRRRGQ
jgi:hypothetical protein